MAENKFVNRPKTVLDDAKWRLRGEKPVEGAKYPPSCQLYQKSNGNPAFQVYLNNGKEGDNGKIVASLDPYAINTVFEMVRAAANSSEPMKESMDVLVSFKHGRKLDKPELGQTIIVGKDEDGMVYIGFREERKPAVRFPFTSPSWFRLYNNDGPLPPARCDRYWALAWANGLSELWAQLAVSNWKEPKQKENSGGGYQRQSQGYSGNQNNNWNDNKPQSSVPEPQNFDQDFPEDW